MKTMKVLKALGPIDIKSLYRDSLLIWMLFLPILWALFIRWGLPSITTMIVEKFQFDLSPYYPVIMSYFVILMTPVIFGLVIGFLLLDERDDGTLTALTVTPLSLNNYFTYRIVVPMLLSIVMAFFVYPIANIGNINSFSLLLAAIVAAPMAPLFALALASIAQNKVQGFALMKVSGFISFPPIFAFFMESNWEIAFGIFPSYWSMKIFWLLEAGQPYPWLLVLAGLCYQIFLIVVFIRRFSRVMHQ